MQAQIAQLNCLIGKTQTQIEQDKNNLQH